MKPEFEIHYIFMSFIGKNSILKFGMHYSFLCLDATDSNHTSRILKMHVVTFLLLLSK